jgi:hypothetical protein
MHNLRLSELNKEMAFIFKAKQTMLTMVLSYKFFYWPMLSSKFQAEFPLIFEVFVLSRVRQEMIIRQNPEKATV